MNQKCEIEVFKRRDVPPFYLDDLERMGRRECKFKIGRQYMKDTLKSCDLVFLALQPCETTLGATTRARARRSKLCVAGFALVTIKTNEKGQTTLHVDLLCSGHGNGARILEELKKVAWKNKKVSLVTLEALDDPKVTNFYLRRGFKHGEKPCDSKFINGKIKRIKKYGETLKIKPKSQSGNSDAIERVDSPICRRAV